MSNATNVRGIVPGWDQIAQGIRDQGIARLQRYVQQGSVSRGAPRPIPLEIIDMAGLVMEDLAGIPGSTEQFVATASYPIVTATVPASVDSANAPWLLLYNMGDTRPLGDDKEWLVPPLSCEVVEVEGQRRIIGRGVFNSKSGLAGMIDVLELLQTTGNLPVNVEVIVDFEEEVRVDAVTEVLSGQRERYAKCSAALMPLCTEGFGAIWLGYKGVAVARVTLRENRSEVHSGMQSILKAPRLRHVLSKFLACIEDDTRHMVRLPALYGEVAENDRELARQMAGSMDMEAAACRWGVEVSELRSHDVLGTILDESRSHINILSWGSEHCEGTVPTRAYAELEFRISPSVTLTVAQIEDEVRRYLQTQVAALMEDVTLESVEFVAGTGEPFRSAEPDDPFVATLQRSYNAFGVEIPLVPTCFGSVPEGAVIRRELDIPFLVGGLGVGDRAHVPNEYILAGAYERFKEWLVVFLHQFAH